MIKSFPPVQLDYFALDGGLDLVTPALAMQPGLCRETQNIEIGINGGYKFLDGYERFDGRPSPSDAVYYMLPVTITGSVSAGDTVTGAVTGATGYVIAVEAANVVITKLVSTFNGSEDLNVGGSPQATMTSTAVQGGAADNQTHWQYLNLAADAYRSDIGAITGSGNVRGVWYYEGDVYAFRNHTDGLSTKMWKSTTGGWTEVSLGREIAFTSGGTTAIAVGNTITGAISGATAVVTYIYLTSGSWAGGDAAGYIYFASQTGTFQAENLDVGATLNLATIAGDSSALSLSPNGRYEFVNANFGSGLMIYGCDGANKAFQYDGTQYVPIRTGMATDTPDHIAFHVNHLFLAFDNSLQHSATGDPLTYSVVLGAGELNLGETITNLLPQPGDSSSAALACYTRNKTMVLYGTSSSDWNLVTLQADAGALAHTAQFMGQTFVFDDRGITTLQTSQNFGNFAAASVSNSIRPYIIENKSRVIASGISRDKNQYRVFLNNGRAIYMTMGRGYTTVVYGDNFTCYTSSEDTSGNEVAFAGDDSGYVHQLDKGTSFDGDDIECYMNLVFNHIKSPRTMKRYRKLALEVTGTAYGSFYFSAEIGYASSDLAQIDQTQTTVSLSEGAWDTGVWDIGVWDGRILSPTEFELSGTAENISVRIFRSSDYQPALTFYSALVHYTPRRLLR